MRAEGDSQTHRQREEQRQTRVQTAARQDARPAAPSSPCVTTREADGRVCVGGVGGHDPVLVA